MSSISALRAVRIAVVVMAVAGAAACADTSPQPRPGHDLVELEVAGPLGFIEGVSLRLFDTQRQRWTLNYASVTGGTLDLPMSGGFNGGRHGIFYGAEMFGGKPILVRFVIDVLDADHCRFEQAFSADGGATWEVNWIALDTRLS